MAEESRTRIIILAGATGYIGLQVLCELIKRGYFVFCVGRNLADKKFSNYAGVQALDLELTSKNFDLDNLKKKIPKAYAVISCIGSRKGGIKDSWNIEYFANKNLLNFAQTIDCQQFILLSAICVQRPKLHFQQAKLAFEAELMSSDITYSIVRPTAYFKSLAGQISNIKAGKPFILFDSGLNTACKPISKEDLAVFICNCLTLSEMRRKIIPIGGPGPAITPIEQSKLLFSKAERPVKNKSIPSWIFLSLSYFLAPFSMLSDKLADYREFLRIAYYYATESMLVWDQEKNQYSDEDTPEYGKDKLGDFYESIMKNKDESYSRVDTKLF
tara:strand:+ start:1320 stop:2306 length:987 start_codon:yes stop_codon:yes gene_type:complete